MNMLEPAEIGTDNMIMRDIGDTSKNFSDIIAMLRNLNHFERISNLLDPPMTFAEVRNSYELALTEDPINSEKLAV